ncbi:hypothetical protein EIP91_010765 [Steccherinum ochraceum]|uniref:Uncharacterized protein n=1 Tax=Steccherinum ochraceum TaxID=92696 RepID=A0A4R0R8T8_9APHY|nr:hypothetical protein EIP91_010765 [Steccherinum ochraceum]
MMRKRVDHPGGAHPANGAPNNAPANNAPPNNAANGHPNGAPNGAPNAQNGGGGVPQNVPNHFPPALLGSFHNDPPNTVVHNPNLVEHNPLGANAPEHSAVVEEVPERRRAFDVRRRSVESAMKKRVDHPGGAHPANGAPNNAPANNPPPNNAPNGHPNGAPNAQNGGGGQNLPAHFPPALTNQVGTVQQPQTPTVVTQDHNQAAANAQEHSAPVEEWPGRRRALNARRHLLGGAMGKRMNNANGAPNGTPNGHPNGAPNGAPAGGANGAPNEQLGVTLPAHFPPALMGNLRMSQQPQTPTVVTGDPANAHPSEQPRAFWERGL